MSLTLAEARDRAAHVEVESYGIDLDLTGWERGRFACTTAVRFTSGQSSTFLELTAAGHEVTRAGVLADVKARDERDSSRSAAPLRPAEDAVVLDTSELDIEAAVAAAVATVAARRG